LDIFEIKQRDHFDQCVEYLQRDDDITSRAYRSKYIYDEMFKGIHLENSLVLDAMCGTGQATRVLLDRGARVVGMDISEASLRIYKKQWSRCEAICASILNPNFASNSFDAVVVSGGLHHLHPHVNEAVTAIYDLLKSGGHFCVLEPHDGSVFDLLRKIWYRLDHKMFKEQERGVDIEDLKSMNAGRFIFEKHVYLGNIAYLLVCNASAFRIPARWKPFYAPVLMKVEDCLAPFQGKYTSAFVVGVWRKS
jgi:SAM-dependent methyltransferase